MIELQRKTKETDISLKFELYGSGKSKIQTGIGFLDHMLSAFAKHSLINLELTCKGDLEVDNHHSTEDCGILLGSAFAKALFPVQNIERFANAIAVMDEAAVSADIDISGRAFLFFKAKMKNKIGSFESELVQEFWQAFVNNAKITLHINKIRGKNSHHIAEAIFKAVALAIRRSVAKNERINIPSTKGVL